jgi:tryptase
MRKYFVIVGCVFGLTACNQRLAEDLFSDAPFSASIIGGEQIVSRLTPASKSVVLIEFLNSEGVFYGTCTATLVSGHSVLTAAHCFDRRVMGNIHNYNIIFDSVYRGTGDATKRRVVRYKVHPDYNTERDPLYGDRKVYDHDLTVVTFAGELPKGFVPIKMDMDKEADYSNKTVIAYGAGRSVDYTGMPGEDLRYSVGILRRGPIKIDAGYTIKADRYWSSLNSPTQLCQGDSGGPQFYQEGRNVKLVGVNSASLGKPLPNGRQGCTGPSQAIKVAPFYKWITEQMKR